MILVNRTQFTILTKELVMATPLTLVIRRSGHKDERLEVLDYSTNQEATLLSIKLANAKMRHILLTSRVYEFYEE